MKTAILIVGPESSGTKMLTEAFIRCGYFGDSSFEQRMDDLSFDDRPERIVFRRSIPHGDDWPDLSHIVEGLHSAGYEVRPVLIWRDKDCCRQSQQANQKHAEETAIANIPDALEWAYDRLVQVAWPTAIYYGAFVKNPAVRKAFFFQFGLEPPDMEFLDQDRKYVAAGC